MNENTFFPFFFFFWSQASRESGPFNTLYFHLVLRKPWKKRAAWAPRAASPLIVNGALATDSVFPFTEIPGCPKIKMAGGKGGHRSGRLPDTGRGGEWGRGRGVRGRQPQSRGVNRCEAEAFVERAVPS